MGERRMSMITDKEFTEATKKFDDIEKRGSFYNMAVNLINKNFEIEAYLLIIATWNSGCFKFAVNDFDTNEFKGKIEELNPRFDRLKGKDRKDFKTINFDEYKEDIKTIFEVLSSIPGVKFTGASKIMHLKNRKVFVMWDEYIRGGKPERYYQKLKIVRNEDWDWKINKYEKNFEGYFQFLKDMQKKFKRINFQSNEKTFAKAIDEFNYVNITLRIQEMEKDEKMEKKKNGKNEKD